MQKRCCLVHRILDLLFYLFKKIQILNNSMFYAINDIPKGGHCNDCNSSDIGPFNSPLMKENLRRNLY